ncbi:hypothetical protein [Azospirillum picis]|uniref:Uncharacterized protein n=2 Tax=Azospirillum picis TaxID=488438 RepID=A0ABU0MU83_9PROT|nr:hypothetical protein [Azospirillum picis]MBP2302981.1 hypothetical protein [Azospirillum picis]MDQ0536733.1 hypothetical protein [Azospirillum picis]
MMAPHRLKPVFASVALAFGALAAFLAVSGPRQRVWAQIHGRQAGALAEGLGGLGWKQASTEFDACFRRRFPIGTPLSDMAEALQGEGFVPTVSELPGWGERVLRRDGPVCRVSARVLWQADAAARLTQIQGLYREDGSL